VTADRFSNLEPVPLRLVSTPVRNGMVRLAVGGEVDIATVDRLRDVLRDLVHDRQVTSLIVDFDQVTFVDSTGVAALMAAYRAVQARRVAFKLTNCGPQALRVLEVLGVDKVLMSGA
jgi:anti-sigma B factor antagonist